MPKAASTTKRNDPIWRGMRWMSGPSPVQFPGWLYAFTGRPSSWGEVLILGSVSERLWLMIRVLCYDDSGKSRRMKSNVVAQVCNLCRVSIYSNSRVHGYGRLERPYSFRCHIFENDVEKDDGEMTCGELNWNHHLHGGNDTNVPTWVWLGK